MWQLALLLAIGLAACSEKHAPTVDERNAARVVRADQFLLRTPSNRVYHFGNGELTAIEVPFMDEFGFIDKQRCVLWRDTEFKTATMACGQQQDSIDLTANVRRTPSASRAASDP